jgi:hypothetical protein
VEKDAREVRAEEEAEGCAGVTVAKVPADRADRAERVALRIRDQNVN